MAITTSSIDSSACWLLGCCFVQSGTVRWLEFEHEQTAKAAFFDTIANEPRQSIVLFQYIGSSFVPCQMCSRHKTDVAAILVACWNRTTATLTNSTSVQGGANYSNEQQPLLTSHVDRSKVERLVENGDAPMVPPSRSQLHQWLLKRAMDVLFHRPVVQFFSAGPHRMSSLCYFDVTKHSHVRDKVALTLDDAPCRFGPANSCLGEIQDLLKEYKAKATFMLVGKFIEGHEDDLVQLLQDGHELGNHGMMDRPHHDDSDQDFIVAMQECSAQILALQKRANIRDDQQGVRFFRAPHAKYTKRMEELIQAQGMINVMCDSYASCPIVEDGNYIGDSLVRQATHGSIILLHIPEKGFRDWCMVALRRLLAGLKQRNIDVISVGMMQELATRSNTD